MHTPTVKIKHGSDYAIINESDFDPDVHELFDAKPAKKVPARKASKSGAKKKASK